MNIFHSNQKKEKSIGMLIDPEIYAKIRLVILVDDTTYSVQKKQLNMRSCDNRVYLIDGDLSITKTRYT